MTSSEIYPSITCSFNIYINDKSKIFEKMLEDHMRRTEIYCNPNASITMKLKIGHYLTTTYIFKNIKEYKDEKELFLKELNKLIVTYTKDVSTYNVELKI